MNAPSITLGPDATKLVVGALISISMGLGGWALGRSVSQGERLVALEQWAEATEKNRFRSSDALALEMRVQAQIATSVGEIKTCLNRIQRNQTCD